MYRNFALALLAAFCFGAVLSGCSGDGDSQSAATEARIERERSEAAEQARLEEKVKSLESEVKKSKKAAKEAAAPSSTQASDSAPTSSSTGSWPSNTSAWTVILTSAGSKSDAQSVATRARNSGLGEVGILYSGDHSSLRAGYWVAYTGVLDKSGAVSRQGSARSAGFSDAYARYVSAD